MAQCPHCGEKIEVRIVGADGLSREQTSLWDRLAAHRRGRYETTATPIAAQPQERARRSLGASPLANGEERSAQRYRAVDLGDVATSVARSVGTAFAATAIGIVGTIAWNAAAKAWFPLYGLRIRLPWYSPLLAGLAYGAWSWLRIDAKQLSKDLITSFEEMTRLDLNGDGKVGNQPKPPPLEVLIKERAEDPRLARQAMVLLERPASNPGGLADYCGDLVAERAFLSLDGGKGGPGARRYGYTESEFEVLRGEMERGRLIEGKGTNQGYGLTEKGEHTLARVAERRMESLSLGIRSPIPRGVGGA